MEHLQYFILLVALLTIGMLLFHKILNQLFSHITIQYLSFLNFSFLTMGATLIFNIAINDVKNMGKLDDILLDIRKNISRYQYNLIILKDQLARKDINTANLITNPYFIKALDYAMETKILCDEFNVVASETMEGNQTKEGCSFILNLRDIGTDAKLVKKFLLMQNTQNKNNQDSLIRQHINGDVNMSKLIMDTDILNEYSKLRKHAIQQIQYKTMHHIILYVFGYMLIVSLLIFTTLNPQEQKQIKNALLQRLRLRTKEESR